MIQKLMMLWNKVKSCAGTIFALHDLIEFFVKLWEVREWLLIGTVLLWIPALKVAMLLYLHFGIAIPYMVARKYSKIVLRTIYWLTVIAAIANMVAKYNDGYDHTKLLALTVGYIFVFVMDFIETEETIKKIEEDIKE